MNDIKNLITHLLEYATEQGADLHICPKSAPFVRSGSKNGALRLVPGFVDWHLDAPTVKALVGELLTPEQKSELLKNDYADVAYAHGELGRFRVSVYTQRGTHAVTIHPLPFEAPELRNLGLGDSSYRAVEIITTEKTGLIVVAGDCFSEKAVTLAGLVDLINENRNCHISTIENPIEYLHRHKKAIVTQKEIGSDVADFGTALRQIRQENPDVVVLSELRREDVLSVMELAEERLVLTAVRTPRMKEGETPHLPDVLTALCKTAAAEAEKHNIGEPFLPDPNITVMSRNGDDMDIFDNF